MPKQKDLKRRVRSRMAKTGESYTTARTQLLAKRGAASQPAPARYAEIAGMSDDAVAAKTGKNWRQWVAVLDAVDATAMTHRDIARYLRDELDVAPWWSQTVTVAYERIRGLRDVGQRRGGGYDVNKSKTLPVPVTELYECWQARQRARWLDLELRIKKATRPKSMRIAVADGTSVDVYFWEKGASKSQVQIQHRGLPSKAAAERVREAWTKRIAKLAAMLSSPPR